MLIFLSLLTLEIASAQERNIPDDLPNPITLTIQGVGTGDRGCYISGIQQTPEGPREWGLMGEFGCEDSLITGLSYELHWYEQNVLAAACEGDVDCGLSDIEPLVSQAKRVPRPWSPECLDVGTQMQMNACFRVGAANADEEMQTVLSLIRARSEDPVFVKKLDASQHAWEVYRDAQISARFPAEDTRREYGSMYPSCHQALKETITRDRIEELMIWLEGVEEGEVCSGSVPLSPRP
jgi:uncharacterized protein YecT (DUF1311 family)